jgi:hypothetical protein
VHERQHGRGRRGLGLPLPRDTAAVSQRKCDSVLRAARTSSAACQRAAAA